MVGGTEEQQAAIGEQFEACAPGIKIVPHYEATLLGSPLSREGIPKAIKEKSAALERLRMNLRHIGKHSSLFLLKNCFMLPKLLYCLRTVPTWECIEELKTFDKTQKLILEDTLNIALDDESWTQATLPVRDGGLGIRKAEDLAIPAYCSSLHASKSLADTLLPNEMALNTNMENSAAQTWSRVSGTSEVPTEPARQRSWDKLIIGRTYQSLIQGSTSIANQARLTAVVGPCAGAWLEATPIAALGTRLDDEAVRIAISLRLGCTVVVPHTCKCATAVLQDGLHGLDCNKCPGGRNARHSELNALVHRSLSAAGRPSILEPRGMAREDGRQPDGLTLFPWHRGKPLVWDVTCVSTLAPSHVQQSITQPGAAAAHAEDRKRTKYSDLATNYHFTPLGFETIGHWGPSTIEFVGELGRLLAHTTGEPRSTAFLRQRLSVAIQRGNAAAVRGTVPAGGEFSELFNLPFEF